MSTLEKPRKLLWVVSFHPGGGAAAGEHKYLASRREAEEFAERARTNGWTIAGIYWIGDRYGEGPEPTDPDEVRYVGEAGE